MVLLAFPVFFVDGLRWCRVLEVIVGRGVLAFCKTVLYFSLIVLASLHVFGVGLL